MTSPLDLAHLRQWIGRTEVRSDFLSAQLAAAYAATLVDRDEPFSPGEAVPPCIHWCLAQPVAPMDRLGEDGHPARGGFLPPVPLPRRMWAGSRIEFGEPLRVGDTVQRLSTVKSVDLKRGASGELCFVTVEHIFRGRAGDAVREEQDLVYRAPPASSGGEAGPARRPADEGASSRPEHRRVVAASPVLLFRYSALTFNGHRIHYDWRYATAVEGYPGLVVHGPLQASLLVNLAAQARGGTQPSRFVFRAARPLFDGAAIELNGRFAGPGEMALWTGEREDAPFMSARAYW